MRLLEWQEGLAYRAAELDATGSEPITFGAEETYRRADGVTEVRFDGIGYQADGAERCIHKLNNGSMAIWALVAVPIYEKEIGDAMHTAVPDLARGQIERDFEFALQEFLAKRLIVFHEKAAS